MARIARTDPAGWIGPKRDDLIIRDARDMLDVEEIARRCETTIEHVGEVIARSYAHGHLNHAEAERYGVAVRPKRKAA